MFQSSNISPRCLTAWHTYWKIRKSLKQEQTSSHYPQYKPVKGPPVLPGLAQVPCLPLKIHLSSRPSDNLHTALHPEQREQKEQGESRGRARRWSGWAEFRIIDLFTQWLINKKVLPIVNVQWKRGFLITNRLLQRFVLSDHFPFRCPALCALKLKTDPHEKTLRIENYK